MTGTGNANRRARATVGTVVAAAVCASATPSPAGAADPTPTPTPDAPLLQPAIPGGAPSGGSGSKARKATSRRTRTLHRVRPGESLWSIAEWRLGGNASDARVMAYLKRVWTVNELRIATGNPDELRIGTVLRMPKVRSR